jgi:hypothetical protein
MSVRPFDWEPVSEQPVAAVIGRNERRMTDGLLAWDALAFAFVGLMLPLLNSFEEVVRRAPISRKLLQCFGSSDYSRGMCLKHSEEIASLGQEPLEPSEHTESPWTTPLRDLL